MQNYVVYHLHSDLSNGVTNIDSVTKYSEYVKRASELGMTALAISEHGSVFDWYGKKEAIEKAGMKYIHAEEFYITERIDIDSDGSPIKLRDNWHCVLIAKNWDGVREINRLATKSFNRHDGHYYYAPRIELDDLLCTSDNVIITTACLGGILNRADDVIQNCFIKFLAKNKTRCFLEIQHHNVADQITYNKKLVEIHNKYKIPLIAGTDTHSLNEEHNEGRKILQLSKDIRFSDEDGWDLTFKSYDELCDAYKKQGALPEEIYLEAIENTNRMADMVEEFTLDRNTKYPHIYKDPDATFKKKINEAYNNHPYLKTRYPKAQVMKQVKEEYDVYKKVGAIDFMLLETYLREWESKNDIQCGYGRGSVSGSLIAYALGITQMDSIKFGLNFFRFMNPSRVTNADIDTDYCSKDRDKIKYFLLHDKMDLPHIKTSEIITFNTIATKGAIKDVCRALNISLDEAQTISNAVNIDGTIEDSWREKYPEVFKYVDIVNGTIVSIGSHPSGVLVSDLDIDGDVGLCSLSTSDYPVSMLDMHGLDDQMYVKLDILGLDNIGVINECCKLVGIDRLTPDSVDLNDEAVWKSIREDTTMIFQWESNSAKAYLERFMSDETITTAKSAIKDFSYIKWFSFGNGLIRPGCASFRDDVAGGDITVTGFKELDEFLSITFGRVTMQEDIMRFLVKFCGYSDAESDTVRRGIAKKKGTEAFIDEIHDRFVSYSHDTYGADKDLLEEIFPPIKQGILDATRYAFSWNHSDAYSCIGYICGYLRYYYPLEFLTAAFNIFTDKEDKIVAITEYANKIGVKINPIKFRYSKSGYNMDKATNSIYQGVEAIKYMNAEVADKLYEMRNDKLDTFVDLLKVFPGNSRQLEILIKLDYFDCYGPSGTLLRIAELYSKFAGKKIVKKDKTFGIPVELLEKYSTQTEKQYRITDPDAFLTELCSMIPHVELPIRTRIEAQQEYLGYTSIVLPDKKQTGYVMKLDTKYSPKIVVYQFWDGKTVTYKCKKQSYQSNPFDVGAVIKFNSEMRNKSRKDENGQWIRLAETEPWITNYLINIDI